MKGSDLDGLHLPVSIPRSINWWTTVTVCPLFKVFPKNPIHHFHITHKPSCLQAQNLHKHCLPFFSWDSLILGRRVCTQAIHGTTVILDKGTRISQWCPCETDLCTRRTVTWQMQIFFHLWHAFEGEESGWGVQICGNVTLAREEAPIPFPFSFNLPLGLVNSSLSCIRGGSIGD